MASADIFESTKLTLRLKVTKGDPPDKSAEFILMVDGAEHSNHTAKLQGSVFAWPTKAPKIDDPSVKKWPYVLTYKVSHGGKDHVGAESWTVWPKVVELAPQGNDSPVQLKLHQRNKQVQAPPKVPKDKTTKVTLRYAEKFEVQGKFPWKVKNPAVESGQGRKLTVPLDRIPYQVAFEDLAGGANAGSPIKQLVTLKSEKPRASVGLDQKGPDIALHLTVTGVPNDKLAETAGTPVYVRATFDNKTKREDPKHPRKLGATGAKPGDEQKGTVNLDKNGKAVCLLHLPLSGGETCKVEIGSTDQYGDAEKHFVTWRRLHFQISHPGSLAKPNPADYVTSFDEIKVEMVEEPAGAIAANSGPKGAWIDGNQIVSGFGRDALIIGIHNEKAFHRLSFKNKNDARYAHFLICDFQFDAGASASISFRLKAQHVSGTDLSVALSDVDSTDAAAALPTWVKDGKPALRKVAWSIPGRKKQGTIPLANCSVDYANNAATGGRIEAPLPADVQAAYGNAEKVTITIRIGLAAGPYLGSSTKNLLLIAAYDGSGNAVIADADLNKTMVHEVGHALGMVASGISIPGIPDPAAEHTRSYTDRGHQGGHCAKDISAADYNNHAKKLSGLSGTCAMFGEGASTVTRSYCDLCQKLLLPASLSRYFLQNL